MNWGGRHVVVGFASGGATPKSAIPKIPLNLALLNERKVSQNRPTRSSLFLDLGMLLGTVENATPREESEKHQKDDGHGGIRKIESGYQQTVRCFQISPSCSLPARYNFSNYMQAFRDMMSRKVIGKSFVILCFPFLLFF